jgi:2-methylaconitate cis-trans-isomerase PrpF
VDRLSDERKDNEMSKKIPVAMYRGGTSRALFFHKSDLPESMEEQDELVLRAFGSGHPLQVDGLGGGNPLTSKCAVIGPPTVPEVDIDYTFLYPAVETRMVDRKGNCGNISSAVGPFAVNENLVQATGDTTSVLIHNTNTRSLLRATFATREGRFFPDGDFSIDGVPGTGSRIDLEFLGDPSQPLLPSGNVRDQLEIPELGRTIDVTILRAGNLTVFCRMDDLEINGNPEAWKNDEVLWRKMEAVRGAGAVYLGMAKTLAEAREKSPAVPKIVAVGPPEAYTDLQGRKLEKGSYQVRTLMAAMGVMHRSVAVTATVSTAAAAVLPGSVVYELREGKGSDVHIGHPSGTLKALAELDRKDGLYEAGKVAISRTARQILQGTVFV